MQFFIYCLINKSSFFTFVIVVLVGHFSLACGKSQHYILGGLVLHNKWGHNLHHVVFPEIGGNELKQRNLW